MKYDKIIKRLKSLANPKNVAGMARFGIKPKTKILGISIWDLRKIKKEVLKDSNYQDTAKRHQLSQKLWATKIHEARILASFIDDPKLVTEKQMDDWIADFDSWDVCDQVISSLFDQTSFAYKKAFDWTKRKPEFEKRSGFVMMAALAVHDKLAPNNKLAKFFPIIRSAATDERNFVKKAVNWALRNIGKRNKALNKLAITVAKEILEKYPDSKSARFIAKDAIRELTSEKVQKRLKK